MKISTSTKGKKLEVWISHKDTWMNLGAHDSTELLNLSAEFLNVTAIIHKRVREQLDRENQDAEALRQELRGGV